MLSLAQKFSHVPFARTAEKWIEASQKKSIPAQLIERRIVRLGFMGMHGPGEAVAIMRYLKGSRKYFEVLLNVFEWQMIWSVHSESLASSLGHEIGHTFDLLEGKYFKWPEHFVNPNALDVENFCDDFAEYWVKTNGEQRIENYLDFFFDGVLKEYWEQYVPSQGFLNENFPFDPSSAWLKINRDKEYIRKVRF